MFTGIVEKTVRVIAVVNGPGFRRVTLASTWDDVKHGESVAVNGVCLTVAEILPGELGFDVIKETLEKTNLGLLEPGHSVNVERSLRANDRIHGHFVQGHVDGVARLIEQISNEKEWRLKLEAPPELAKYLIPKGSVCVDGVSLTLAAINSNVFELALIPTTIQLTTLGNKEIGYPFNLEADVLSKTIVSFLERQQAPDS